MLDKRKLRRVSWDQLSHAYGPATDTPRLLAALTGKSTREPLDELWSSIVHQGTRYSATSVAVPFLVDLVLDKRTHRRVEIIKMLETCAGGYATSQLRWQRLEALQGEGPDRASWDAVVAEQPRLLELLGDADTEVRDAALTLLSWTGSPANEMRAALAQALDEDWPSRLTAYLCCVVLGASPPDEALDQKPTTSDRFGWAAAALRFRGDSCPESAIEVLCTSLSTDQPELARSMFLLSEDPAQFAVELFAETPEPHRVTATDRLLDLASRDFAWGHSAAGAFLRLWLGPPDNDVPDSLTVDQRAALDQLAEVIGRWPLGPGEMEMPLYDLRQYGLPEHPTELARWLRALP